MNKRSSSQKNLNLSPTQRLDNLIQASTNDVTTEGRKTIYMNAFFLYIRLIDNESKKNSTTVPRPPPIPPRQTKADEKPTIVSTSSSSMPMKQVNPTVNEHTNGNSSKG